MLGNAPLEVGQRLLALRLQADVDEHIEPQAQRRRIGQRHIAGNHARRLQRLHPRQAGRGRQMHAARQLHVGERAIGLQLGQNAQIGCVKLHAVISFWCGILCF